jgi:hypothetical protein
MRHSILVIVIAAIIVSSGVLIIVYGLNLFSKDYSLEMDPRRANPSIFKVAI